MINNTNSNIQSEILSYYCYEEVYDEIYYTHYNINFVFVDEDDEEEDLNYLYIDATPKNSKHRQLYQLEESPANT